MSNIHHHYIDGTIGAIGFVSSLVLSIFKISLLSDFIHGAATSLGGIAVSCLWIVIRAYLKKRKLKNRQDLNKT